MLDEHHRESAQSARLVIERGQHDPSAFKASLLSVPASARDAWVDCVLGLTELADDGPALPSGCVPYMPCSVDVLLRMVERARVTSSDVFVDIGSGVGRAAALVHLLTGASAMGVEIQPELAVLSRVPCIAGDAADLAGSLDDGSVFLLYCPFGGERLARVLEHLESIARTKALRICCVDLPLPARAWLKRDPEVSADLTVYRSY